MLGIFDKLWLKTWVMKDKKDTDLNISNLFSVTKIESFYTKSVLPVFKSGLTFFGIKFFECIPFHKNISELYTDSTQHLQDVNMSYTEHLTFSMSMAYTFSKGSLFAFIHSIIPGLYKTSSRDLNFDLTSKLHHITSKEE